jgi:cobalt-zinc-cadmium efflux system protein
MGAGHSHGHSHEHGRGADTRRLGVVLALVVVYMFAEVVGGVITNSLALLADAGHMLSDAGALALSLFALWIAQRPPTSTHTYGFHRTEILAALANGVTLVAISIFIVLEAFHRFGNPPEVEGGLMMVIAIGGLVINLVGLAVLSGGRKGSLNVRGAWLHVLTDALGSLGTIAAGALIWAFRWEWADPVASVVVAALVLWSSWALLRDTVGVLMERAPGDIDVEEVRHAISEVPGVLAAHDLHVWTITSGRVALSCHVCAGDDEPAGRLLRAVQERLRAEFGIAHSTVQVEPRDFEGPDEIC